MRLTLTLLMMFSLSACLKTRSELRGEAPMAQQAEAQRFPASEVTQAQRAQNDIRFSEINRDFRELYGKIEVIEQKLSDMKQVPQANATEGKLGDKDQVKALEKRISTLEEALLAIDKKLSEMSKNKTSAISTQKPKGPFGYGEMYYAQGKYEDAITSYDKYRKKFPRGRRYAQATLKMGLSFQKLKMNQDAKAFYKEVIQRYPKTRVAVQAQKNLKTL